MVYYGRTEKKAWERMTVWARCNSYRAILRKATLRDLIHRIRSRNKEMWHLFKAHSKAHLSFN
jgi:hypothetical protein